MTNTHKTLLLILLAIILVIPVYVEAYTEYTRLDCPTRNMSYDWRGEASFPERSHFIFANSSIGAIDPSKCHRTSLGDKHIV
jgi:hypothetical protein